jgi:hypothetical protein
MVPEINRPGATTSEVYFSMDAIAFARLLFVVLGGLPGIHR